MRHIEGLVVWVTGAGTGIGEASAIALAEAGAKVVLSGRRPDPLHAVAAKITDAGGVALVEPGDARDRDGMFAIARRVHEKFGRLDMLFNNHGTNVTPRKWAQAEFDQWDDVIDVNVKGAYNCAGAALAIMVPAGDGLIVTTSSRAGRFYSPVAGPAYGASKHAVMALNETINLEHGNDGIRACAICPGEVATPILDLRPVPLTAEMREQLIQPEDLAELVVFLAEAHPRICVNEVVISPSHKRTYRPGET